MAKPMLIFSPKMVFWDNSGALLNGGQVFIYQPGTTTLMNTYPSAANAVAGTNPNPNPIILNSAGRPSNNGAEIDLYTTSAFKMVVSYSTDTNPPTNPIWTEDNITTLGQLLSSITKTTSYTATSSNRDNYIKCDTSGGSWTLTLPVASTVGDGFQLFAKKIDNTANTVTITPSGGNLVDGSATYALSAIHGWVQLYCDGTQWFTSGVINVSGQTLYDSNGNAEITFITTAAAVNYLNVTNAATGNAPSITSTGTDTNVNLSIDAKNNASTLILGKNSSATELGAAGMAVPNTTGTSGQYLTTNGSTAWQYTTPVAKFTSINIQTFTSTGTYTPTTGIIGAMVYGVGGGGGGAGCSSNSGNVGAGAQGGAAGYVIAYATAAQLGSSGTVTIGAAGTAGALGNIGGNGGNTSLVNATTSLTIQAGGGNAGQQTLNSSGAFSGAGGNGGTNNIANASAIVNQPGMRGGNVCGTNSIGIFTNGGGGNTPLGAGGACGIGPSTVNGSAATGNGAGGGGGITIGSANASGGAGTIGLLTIVEFIGSTL